MPWYPDWLVALDECSKSDDGLRRHGPRTVAIITPRQAQDIIRELTALKRQVMSDEDHGASSDNA